MASSNLPMSPAPPLSPRPPQCPGTPHHVLSYMAAFPNVFPPPTDFPQKPHGHHLSTPILLACPTTFCAFLTTSEMSAAFDEPAVASPEERSSTTPWQPPNPPCNHRSHRLLKPKRTRMNLLMCERTGVSWVFVVDHHSSRHTLIQQKI